MTTSFVRRQNIILVVALVFIILNGTLLRLSLLSERPGWELDEVVYMKVSQNLIHDGYVWLTAGEPYLSHPPFYFYLLGSIYRLFGSGIVQGRVIAALSQMIAFICLFFAMRDMHGKFIAFAATCLILVDSWILFTGRVGQIENSQLVLVVFAVWQYHRAQKQTGFRNYIFAGILIGIVVIYKHIGAYIVLMVVFNWLFQRKQHQQHIILLMTVLLVMMVYGILMYAVWGNEFIYQYIAQINRTIGLKYSPGLNYGISQIIEATVAHYWIFLTTILLFGIGIPLTLYRTYQALRIRRPENTIVLAWSLSGICFFGIISLKAPHYFVLLLVPLCCLCAIEIMSQKSWVRILAMIVLFVLANGFTWNMRFIQRQENLLKDVQQYAITTIPLDDTVFSTEPICSIIPQHCVKLEGQSENGIAEAIKQSQWILAYESTTQPFPIPNWNERTIFSGFKDKVTVFYRYNQH